MFIRELNVLDEDLTKDIKELIAACNMHDGFKGMLSLDTSFNFNQEMNCIFVMYDGSRLVSALTLFAPGSEEAEVTAMTLPEYRGRGCFDSLVQRAETELVRHAVPDILFVCEERAAAGKAAMAGLKAMYEFTEYTMKYNHSMDKAIREYDYRMKLQEAGMQDIPSLIEIGMSAFNDSYEGAQSMALAALNSPNRQVFLGEVDGLHVAMGVAAAGEESTCIHGLGVMPEQQGKGFGKEMLYAIIKRLLEQDVREISLEVNSENDIALRLYTSSGFEVQNAWEYYRKPVQGVRR